MTRWTMFVQLVHCTKSFIAKFARSAGLAYMHAVYVLFQFLFVDKSFTTAPASIWRGDCMGSTHVKVESLYTLENNVARVTMEVIGTVFVMDRGGGFCILYAS